MLLCLRVAREEEEAVCDDDTCVYTYNSVTYTLSLSRFIHKVVSSDFSLFSECPYVYLPTCQVEIASRRMTVVYLTSSH